MNVTGRSALAEQQQSSKAGDPPASSTQQHDPHHLSPPRAPSAAHSRSAHNSNNSADAAGSASHTRHSTTAVDDTDGTTIFVSDPAADLMIPPSLTVNTEDGEGEARLTSLSNGAHQHAHRRTPTQRSIVSDTQGVVLSSSPQHNPLSTPSSPVQLATQPSQAMAVQMTMIHSLVATPSRQQQQEAKKKKQQSVHQREREMISPKSGNKKISNAAVRSPASPSKASATDRNNSNSIATPTSNTNSASPGPIEIDTSNSIHEVHVREHKGGWKAVLLGCCFGDREEKHEQSSNNLNSDEAQATSSSSPPNKKKEKNKKSKSMIRESPLMQTMNPTSSSPPRPLSFGSRSNSRQRSRGRSKVAQSDEGGEMDMHNLQQHQHQQSDVEFQVPPLVLPTRTPCPSPQPSEPSQSAQADAASGVDTLSIEVLLTDRLETPPLAVADAASSGDADSGIDSPSDVNSQPPMLQHQSSLSSFESTNSFVHDQPHPLLRAETMPSVASSTNMNMTGGYNSSSAMQSSSASPVDSPSLTPIGGGGGGNHKALMSWNNVTISENKSSSNRKHDILPPLIINKKFDSGYATTNPNSTANTSATNTPIMRGMGILENEEE